VFFVVMSREVSFSGGILTHALSMAEVIVVKRFQQISDPMLRTSRNGINIPDYDLHRA